MKHGICHKRKEDSLIARGFTLMEILVVIGIFMSTITILVQIFSSVTNLQRNILARQNLIENARATIDAVFEEVRLGRIDYAKYGGGVISNPMQQIFLIGKDGFPVTITISDESTKGACPTPESHPCLFLHPQNGQEASFTSQDVVLTDIRFFIEPSTDPFTAVPGSGFLSNIQPRVTMSMTFDTSDPSLRGKNPLTVQTTVTSRFYGR